MTSIILSIFFLSQYVTKLQTDVIFYKTQANLMETAHNKCINSKVVVDNSNYPFVLNKKGK